MNRILVVDDDEALRDVLFDFLSAEGLQVSVCEDGDSALALLDETPFDIALLDIMLPNYNGFELLERIRFHPNTLDLPVIMMSGIYEAQANRKRLVHLYEIQDYLDKPLDLPKLLEIINKVIKNSDKKSKKTSSLDATTKRPGMNTVMAKVSGRAERKEIDENIRDNFGGRSIIMQGSIQTKPVAAILGKLWQQKETGALLLRNEEQKKIIYLRAGSVYEVKSNLVKECLGQVLLQERLINKEELYKSVELMRESNQRQGEILVKMNALSTRNLHYALGKQVETRLFQSFEWDEGEYRFNHRATVGEINGILDWNGPKVVIQGIKRTFTEGKLRELLPLQLTISLSDEFHTYPIKSFGFSKSEKESVELLKQNLSIDELVEKMPLTPRQSLALIYSLLNLGLLHAEDEE